MKVSSETKNVIAKLVLRNAEVTQNEIIDIIKENDERPSVETLMEKEYIRTANRVVSSVSKQNGDRDVFAIRGNRETPTTYINIEISDDKAKLVLIKNRLEKHIEGTKRSLQKASNRLAVLDGQITLKEIIPNYILDGKKETETQSAFDLEMVMK